MKPNCPHCTPKNDVSGFSNKVKKSGHFKRKSDSRWVQIFRCLNCFKYFSRATLHPCYRQKKRHLNYPIILDLSSSTSMRRTAKLYGISRTTVARKLRFLGAQAEVKLREENLKKKKAVAVQFDDLETFEHTKCKPLSITLAVEKHSRRILGFEVSQMAAKGRLAKLSIKKYGPRKDERSKGRDRLFKSLTQLVESTATFESDQNPYYPRDLKAHFPNSIHLTHEGQRGAITGQGELKKTKYDPLFSLNHTCAMLRDNIKRLSRKTWCTTKLPKNLHAHLAIYALFHNTQLLKPTWRRSVVGQFSKRNGFLVKSKNLTHLFRDLPKSHIVFHTGNKVWNQILGSFRGFS